MQQAMQQLFLPIHRVPLMQTVLMMQMMSILIQQASQNLPMVNNDNNKKRKSMVMEGLVQHAEHPKGKQQTANVNSTKHASKEALDMLGLLTQQSIGAHSLLTEIQLQWNLL